MSRLQPSSPRDPVQPLGQGASGPPRQLGTAQGRIAAKASRRWPKALCFGALAAVTLIAGFGAAVPSAVAASAARVELGQASTYAVLSGASVGNTVNAMGAPHTTLRGDLGVSVNAQPTGFPPGVVTGTTRVGSAAAQAHSDLVGAYSEVASRTGGAALAGDLIGLRLSPGLYSNAGAVANTGTVILDGGGNANAVFVFKIGGAFSMAAGARITLTNGTKASNVFWQVNGAGSVGANDTFSGTLMALNAIAMGAGTLVNGRALALNGAVSLDSDEFYSAPPAVDITGGATAITNHSAPAIGGTTDVVEPSDVTVTIAGQTLTALPSEGVWSVTSATLANGTYPVVATVTDGAGNQESFTQQLTIDTVLPVVTIDGGSPVTANNPTATLAGSSDVAPGTVVRVTVGSQTLTALVQSDGTWNVTTVVGEGTWLVVASVRDPAGNLGSASQVLTIAAHPPSGSSGIGQTGAAAQTTGTAGAGATLMVWLSAVSFRAARGRPIQVPFVLSDPAKVTLTISRGNRVAAVLSIGCPKAGRCRIIWNGKIKRKLAPRGAYSLTVRAISAAGASSRDVGKARIT